VIRLFCQPKLLYSRPVANETRPPEIVVSPVYVSCAVRVSVPAPLLFKSPLPLSTPDRVMVLPLVSNVAALAPVPLSVMGKDDEKLAAALIVPPLPPLVTAAGPPSVRMPRLPTL